MDKLLALLDELDKERSRLFAPYCLCVYSDRSGHVETWLHNIGDNLVLFEFNDYSQLNDYDIAELKRQATMVIIAAIIEFEAYQSRITSANRAKLPNFWK